MHSELFFKGKKITDKERKLLSDVFEEKIDDLYLCQSILLAAMRPENVLARSAFTRALTRKHCGYTDGGREARKLIRRIRRKLGYRLSIADRWERLKYTTKKVHRDFQEHDAAIKEDIGEVIGAAFRLIFFFL
ncbi:MAG: hypothetical protein ACAH83_02330 [Alphaproteobacteria bacterium]